MSFLKSDVGNDAFNISRSFIASYALNRNFSRACLSAGLAGLASLIDGVTTLLLKKYCFQAEKRLWGQQKQEKKLHYYIEIPKKIILAVLMQSVIFRLDDFPPIKADIDHSLVTQLPAALAEALLRLKALIENPNFFKIYTQINVVALALLGIAIIKKPTYIFF